MRTFGMLLLFFLASCGGVKGVKECSEDKECFEGYRCDVGTTDTCVRSCADDTQCLATQFCELAVGATEGFCRFGAVAGD